MNVTRSISCRQARTDMFAHVSGTFLEMFAGNCRCPKPTKKTGSLVDGQCSFHPGGLFGIGDYTTHLYGIVISQYKWILLYEPISLVECQKS